MLAKRVVTFFKNESKEVLKHTVNHFKKENVPVITIYNIITRYRKHNSTNYLPKTGRPKKISDQELKTLVRLVDNKVGMSQHRLGRRFGVNQSTISRNLKKRTSVRVYKRRPTPKYISEDQQKRAKSNCLKLYKKVSPNCQLILDDEKYFTFSGNVPGNNRYYSSDTSSAPENIKFIQKQKFEPHLLVWLAISPRGISNPYIHRSKIAIREEIYLKQCIRGHLLPFIKKHHQNDDILFWPDLASSHYAYSVLRCLESNNLPYVRRNQNPPNVPQCRPIEKIWALIEQMVYQGG